MKIHVQQFSLDDKDAASKIAQLAAYTDSQLQLVATINPSLKPHIAIVKENRTTTNSRKPLNSTS